MKIFRKESDTMRGATMLENEWGKGDNSKVTREIGQRTECMLYA